MLMVEFGLGYIHIYFSNNINGKNPTFNLELNYMELFILKQKKRKILKLHKETVATPLL